MTGEEVFLGPRMSFASASAARQQRPDDKEDGRPRLDRFRSHTSRDGEPDRFKSRLAQTPDEEEPRRKTMNEREKDDTRRSQARSKFEQPWFRDGAKAAPAENEVPERSWRDRERKPEYDRPQPDPQWMSDRPSETGGHTQEDFAKWKASMKPEEKKEEVRSPAADTPFSSLWDTKKLSEPATSKATAAAKSSRFAGFFAPQAQPEPVQEVKAPVREEPKRLSSTTEDQEGFQRMMAMLRMEVVACFVVGGLPCLRLPTAPARMVVGWEC